MWKRYLYPSRLARCFAVTVVLAALATHDLAAQSPRSAERVIQLAPLAADGVTPVVTAMAIDPTSETLAVAGDDKSIRILQAKDLQQIAVLTGHRDIIRALAFRSDGKVLASSGNDGNVILWRTQPEYDELRRISELPAVCSLRFSPDGTQLAGVGFGPEVLMFGGTLNREEMVCDCTDLRCLAFDPKGKRLVAVGRAGHVHWFDVASGRDLGHQDIHKGRIRQCAFTSNGERMITVGEDGAAVLFDVERTEVLRRIDLLPCKLFAFANIDDRRIAVAGSDNLIRIIDFETGTVISQLDGHRGSISSLVYFNGSLFSGGFDATVRQWSVAADRGERVAENEPVTSR